MTENMTGEGLPSAYLDHNIYNRMLEGSCENLKNFFKENFQVVYSNETLIEIERSKGFEEKFLRLLNDLGAQYMELILDKKFRITDQVTFSKGPPEEIFNHLQTNRNPISQAVINDMHKFQHKMAGGLKGHSFDSIIAKQRESFSGLTKHISELLSIAEIPAEKIAALPIPLHLIPKLLEQEYETVTERLKTSLENRTPNSENFRGPKDFREKINLGPVQLNNIEPPDVIRKIWETVSKVPEFQKAPLNLNLEKFFGIESNLIHPGEPLPVYEKVVGMYSVLNTIGYYPDQEMEKQRRFTSSVSDSTHAANAIFAKHFISLDKRLSKKVSAIYEYLGIGTKVIFIELNSEQK